MTTTINASTSAGLVQTADTSGSLALQTAGTTAITIDTSQNVGIGITPSAFGSTNKAIENSAGCFFPRGTTNLDIFQNTYFDGTNYKYKATGTAVGYEQWAGGGHYWYVAASGTAGNTITGFANPVMTLDSSGNLLVGTTDSSNASGPGSKIQTSATVPMMAVVQNTSSSSAISFCGFNTNATNNGYRFYVRADGGVYNYSANNFNLSDQTEKKNITLAENYLNKLCQIPVKTFLYNDQGDEDINVGVIAQDVQAVCPEFITTHNIGTEEEPNIKLGVYETDLKYAMLKAIQELKAINDTQAETLSQQATLINALTARIEALENK